MRQDPAQVLIAPVSDALLEGAPAETQHNNSKREGFRRFSASLRKKRGEQLLLVGAEFMWAKINPLVDETIRRVLLNKPWYFNLEQSVCCVWKSIVWDAVQGHASSVCEKEKQWGENDEEPQNKAGRGGCQGLFGKSCMAVWVRRLSVGLLSPSWALIRLTFINLTGQSSHKHWH